MIRARIPTEGWISSSTSSTFTFTGFIRIHSLEVLWSSSFLHPQSKIGSPKVNEERRPGNPSVNRRLLTSLPIEDWSWRRDVRRMDSWVSSFFQPSVDHLSLSPSHNNQPLVERKWKMKEKTPANPFFFRLRRVNLLGFSLFLLFSRSGFRLCYRSQRIDHRRWKKKKNPKKMIGRRPRCMKASHGCSGRTSCWS